MREHIYNCLISKPTWAALFISKHETLFSLLWLMYAPPLPSPNILTQFQLWIKEADFRCSDKCFSLMAGIWFLWNDSEGRLSKYIRNQIHCHSQRSRLKEKWKPAIMEVAESLVSGWTYEKCHDRKVPHVSILLPLKSAPSWFLNHAFHKVGKHSKADCSGLDMCRFIYLFLSSDVQLCQSLHLTSSVCGPAVRSGSLNPKMTLLKLKFINNSGSQLWRCTHPLSNHYSLFPAASLLLYLTGKSVFLMIRSTFCICIFFFLDPTVLLHQFNSL